MTTLQRFEDVDAWKLSREITKLIYQYSGQGKFSKDYCLRDQIRRAAISVMSNIAEGFERGGNKEFIQFLSIAKGFTAEIESQLYIALDNNYISHAQFHELIHSTHSIKSLISGFIRYLKKTDFKGNKFKNSKP